MEYNFLWLNRRNFIKIIIGSVNNMKINDAIAKRINDLCNDKDLAYKLNKSDNISTNKKLERRSLE